MDQYFILKIDTEKPFSYSGLERDSRYPIVLIKNGEAEIIDDGYSSHSEILRAWGDKLGVIDGEYENEARKELPALR